jgi:YVTN family beta-propeller protein
MRASRARRPMAGAMVAVLLAGCTSGGTNPAQDAPASSPVATTTPSGEAAAPPAPSAPHSAPPSSASPSSAPPEVPTPVSTLLPGMPPPVSPTDVYAATRTLSPAVAGAKALVYVPNSIDNTVTVIDQQTMKVTGTFPVGPEPQHVVPSYDLKTLYVASDLVSAGGSLTPIDPTTGIPGARIPVADPYNMYFTPDGSSAIVVAEALKRLDFYDPQTWKLQLSLPVPDCAGVDHLDFTADGRTFLASCEFANKMIVVDVASKKLVRTIALTQVHNGMPQDVKLSPDGQTFFVADSTANGMYIFDGQANGVIGFVPTGKGTHGLYVSRDSTQMFVTNRGEGSISVVDLATRKPVTKWKIPGGGSPDMGNLSVDGSIFWVAGRYDNAVYAISTTDGRLITEIPVGKGPHGLTVWPQPGRYSLGHTGVLR